MTGSSRAPWDLLPKEAGFVRPTQVPEEYYTRVGRTKPTSFGSKAQGARELPVMNAGLPGAG